MLASCAGSDEAAPDTTPEVSTTAATTVPDPTTTSVAPTTEAPTTTTDPTAALAAQVEADYREAIRLGDEASGDPFDRALEEAALERRLGVVRENFAARLADYRDSNYAIRPSESVPATITVEVPARLVPPSDDVAEMLVCEVDSWVLVEVGAGPDQSDAVVDSEINAYRAQVFLRLVDGIWRYEGGNDLASWEGATSCPAG
jgi:hypothetical protein